MARALETENTPGRPVLRSLALAILAAAYIFWSGKQSSHEAPRRQSFGNSSNLILPTSKRSAAIANGEDRGDALTIFSERSSQIRHIDKSKLPYACGVILFYHIPGTGGRAINNWLKGLKILRRNGSYYTDTGDSFIKGMNERVRKVKRNNWLVAYAESNTFSLDSDENLLRQWRKQTEKNGCQFVASTVFQDHWNYGVSQTKKKFADHNGDVKSFYSDLLPLFGTVEGPWTSQLDYFLYKDDEQSTEKISKELKVRRAMELLKEHFDLVTVDDHKKFVETILKITGPPPNKMNKREFTDGPLVFSKDLIEKFRKMAESNGDAHFVDAVSHIYQNRLAFLMEQ